MWFEPENNPVSFELCYSKQTKERSLRWSLSDVSHSSVDSGEEAPGKYKATPLLREASHFDVSKVQSLFTAECKQLPQEISDFVMSALQTCN